MSSQSIISIPPQLEMTPRSIPLLEKSRSAKTSANTEQYFKSEIDRTNKSIANSECRTFYKMAETSFAIKENEPLNLRISLQPKDLMKLAKFKMVNTLKFYSIFD